MTLIRRARLLAAAILSIGAAPAPPPPDPAATIRSPAFQAYVDGAAREHMEALGVPGMAVAIVDRDGSLLIRSYGVGASPDGKPIALDPIRSVLPIASISKTLAMVALMRLVDQGRVSLDVPVNTYLDFRLPTFRGARPITLRDLSRHEAGFEERWLATGTGGKTPERQSWPEIMAHTYPRLIAPPGAYSNYSNYGAALIGYVVQRVSGMPYATFLQREVLLPLGMTSSSVQDPLPMALAARQVLGWKVAGGVRRPDEHIFNLRTHAAGRVQTSLPDMARYMTMLLNGGHLPDGRVFLSPAAIRTLLFDVKRVQPALPGIAAIFAQKDIAGVRFIGHGGDGGAHHTDMILSPERGFGIFVADLAAPGPQARDHFTAAVIPLLAPDATVSVAAAKADWSTSLACYAGAYRHYRWAFTSIEKILGLSSEFAIRDSGKGTLIVMGRLSPGEYLPQQAPGLFRHQQTGEYLFLRPDARGRMILTMGSYPYVTAYRLDTIDTQAFNSVAFWAFVVGLSLFGVTAVWLAIGDVRVGDRRRALGFALLGVALLACGIGLWEFLSIAAALSESELQLGIPGMARPILAIPPLACVLVAAFVGGAVQGAFRPTGAARWLVAAGGTLLFAAFIAYTIHWHAFGWQFP